MPTITFRAKVETIANMDGTPAYQRIKIPELTSRHCNMDEWRKHPEWGHLANSNMFPSILRRLTERAIGEGRVQYIRLDRLPKTVTVDTSGFLARVTIDVGA